MFCLPCPKLQVVSVQVKLPQRKELPLVEGQVPKDAGVEGMHPIDFKVFWEQSLGPLQGFYQLVQIFQSVYWVPRDSFTLICSWEVVVFSPLWFASKLCVLWISLVCPSPGISKTWLLSTCAVKTAQVATSKGQFMSQPWISSRRCRNTWRSIGTSRLWLFFASIRRTGRRQWLDAF